MAKDNNNSSSSDKTFKCAICGGNDCVFLFEAHDYFHYSPSAFNFVKCRRCGNAKVHPHPRIQYCHPPFSYRKKGKPDIWDFLSPNRVRIVEKFKKRGRILDIGCGLGEFLFDMKKAGWEVFGNDVVADACDYAQKEFYLKNIYNKDLIFLDFPDKFFDVITLWHVIEHIEKPLDSLRKINKILKDDGILIIESPNHASCQLKFFKGKWYGLGVPNHIYHFSPKSLEKALYPAGLKIIKRDYFVNLRINFISFKMSLLRAIGLERIPDEKGNNETTFLKWLKKYKLIFLFEVLCFPISLLLALINCGTCFRIYCKKING